MSIATIDRLVTIRSLLQESKAAMVPRKFGGIGEAAKGRQRGPLHPCNTSCDRSRFGEIPPRLDETIQPVTGKARMSLASCLTRREPMKICPRSPSALRRWIGVALVSLASMAAQAQNAIEAVTSTARADVELVRIDFTQPLTALPTGFVVQEPARIALDFPGVTSAVGRSAIEFNLGNLRTANVVQAGERSRVVLNLKRAATYQAEIQGRSLLVSLQSGTGQPTRTSSNA
jgi:hypothetical protein